MSNNEEINKNLELLTNLNTDLKSFDTYLDKLTKLNYDKTLKMISPKERVDLNWAMSYSIYSLYFSKFRFNFLQVLLKSQNVDPKDHKVKNEMVCV